MIDLQSPRHSTRNNVGWRVIYRIFSRDPPENAAAWIYIVLIILAVFAIVPTLFIFAHAATTILTTNSSSNPQVIEAASRVFSSIIPLTIALFGLPFLIWRLATLQSQADIAREGHLTSLMSKALEHLCSMREHRAVKITEEMLSPNSADGRPKAPQLRTTRESVETSYEAVEDQQRGAIYLLARIAADSNRDAWPIAGTLAAYVRRVNSEAARVQFDRSLSEEIRADQDARIRRLSRSSFAQLVDTLWSTGLTVREPIDLNELQFSGEELRRLNMVALDLSAARFHATKFYECTFRDCRLLQASMTAVRWSGRLNTSSTSPDWQRVEADSVVLSGARLDGLSWSQVRASEANFSHGSMRRFHARKCDFIRSSFQGVDLTDATFIDCNLTGANFDGALLDGCSLEGTTGLTSAQLTAAYGNDATRLPITVERPSNWLAFAATKNDIIARDQLRAEHLALLFPSHTEATEEPKQVMTDISASGSDERG